mmetsp:Transcript_56676/g.113535  ORF Transcript_56676/g.113535 Transcript_56676/m.113535 type:complete len:163 (-) Transcript_56676:93-581(-)
MASSRAALPLDLGHRHGGVSDRRRVPWSRSGVGPLRLLGGDPPRRHVPLRHLPQVEVSQGWTPDGDDCSAFSVESHRPGRLLVGIAEIRFIIGTVGANIQCKTSTKERVAKKKTTSSHTEPGFTAAAAPETKEKVQWSGFTKVKTEPITERASCALINRQFS